MPETEAEKTPEQIAADEVNKRINEFMASYQALVKEKDVDFASYPVWVPSEGGKFVTIIQSTPVDMRQQLIKSNFIPDNK